MNWSEDVLIRIAIFVLGFFGFLVARHIYNSKRTGSVLVCPIQFDCHGVVHSDYSRFLGIPLEILGMIYYGFISLSYLFLIFISSTLPQFLLDAMIISSIIAFIFSIYLIFVQIFILKKGCSWCFVSAFISTLIFLLSASYYGIRFLSLF